MARVTPIALGLVALVLDTQSTRAATADGSQPIRRTTAEIMREAAARERPREIQDREIKRKKVDRSRLPRNPRSPLVSRLGETGLAPVIERPAGPPQAPQTVSAPNFTSVTLDEAFALPPDPMGAVGPTQFLTHVNGRVRVHDKTTGAVGPLDVDDFTFWSPVMEDVASGFVSDPRVRFDRLTDRWFMTILDIPSNVGANGSRILLAMSDGPNITGATVWSFFFFDQDLAFPGGDPGCLPDYPTLGIDNNALYIGANMFCGGPGLENLSFSGTSAWVVRKSDLLNPAIPANVTLTSGAIKAFRNLAVFDPDSFFCSPGLYTPQGVDNVDPFATKGYFVGVDCATFGTLVLREVNNPNSGSPTLSGNVLLTVPSTSFPIEVATTGGASLDGLDDRLMAAHLRDGRIWTSHQVAVNGSGVASSAGNRNAVRWYEIDVTAAPAVSQAGTVFDSSSVNPLSYWMGTIMASGQGHAALGFSTASAAVRPGAATVGRLVGDPSGTTQGTPVVYHAGEADYVDPFTGPTNARWGDYSMTTLDPCDDMTMWTTQEFAATPGFFTFNWGVRVVRLLAPPPATPTNATPSSVSAGLPSVTVTIDGNTAGGEGFYDTPAAGMSSCRTRIAAAVGNGVTVNGITFVDADTVTLELNTTTAIAGPANVTITNPDGQSAMGGVLTIDAAAGAVVSGTKTVSGTPAPGGAIFYTVTLSNFGTLAQGDNAGDEFVDVLPSSLVLAAASASSGSVTADVASNTVTWNGSIPAGGSVTITIDATVEPATPAGTIVFNQGAFNYDADGDGTNDASGLTDDPGVAGSASPTVFMVGAALYTVTPCRLLDTRNPEGPHGGPALAAGADRTFTIGGRCDVPSTAKAVSVNVTVTQATTAGNLRLYPAGTSLPLVSAINYAAGATRANNAIVPLNALAEVAVRCSQASGTVHFILDVNGYLQ